MKKLIQSLKETVDLIKAPTNAKSLFAALNQKETRMSVKDFLARKWVGTPDTTTKE
jgi:hypothetical protein